MASAYAAAADYDRHIAPKYAAIARLVADRVPVSPCGVVLEQAVGTGVLTQLLAPRLADWSYVALDASVAMLDVARERVDRRVALLHADVRALPLADASVDVVVSSLGPVQELPEALAEVRRVLAPGGALVASMWGDDYDEYHLLQAVRDRFDAGDYPRDPFPAARQRLADAGLTGVELEVHRLPVRHASVGEYVAYRAGFGCPPWLAAEKFDELLDAVAEAAQPFTDADGSVRLDWEIGVLAAEAPAVAGHQDGGRGGS